jgi:hypothetical protein
MEDVEVANMDGSLPYVLAFGQDTYGFGRMPAWEPVFSDHERMAVTAYLKSDRFSP